MSHSPALVARCALVWLGATTLLLGIAGFLARDLLEALLVVRSGGLAGHSFNTLLVWLCSLVLEMCCAWLWLTSSVAILMAARGWPLHRMRACPMFVRQAVLLACGVAVIGSAVSPAHAAPPDTDPAHAGQAVIGQTLDGLPLPERAVQRAAHWAAMSRTPQARIVPALRRSPTSNRVEVRAGDTLWSIAARTLAYDASVGTINDRRHELYALNRNVIGPNPDLILPGQELRLH